MNAAESGNSHMETKELICILCPRGCRLTAVRNEKSGPEEMEVSGNSCKRGPEYAKQELTKPVRILTALMRPAGSEKPVSVKTDRPVPKEMLTACAVQIYRTHPEGKVRRGDVLIRNILGTGADVVATRDAET